MTFGIPPALTNPLKYTGDQSVTLPAVNNPRAPFVTDNNYTLFTIWRNSNVNAIFPDQEGDFWILTRFSYNNATKHVDAIWLKMDTSGGGGAIDSINVDAHTAPGTDPVFPDITGQITVTGAQVATGVIGSNVIRTDSLAVNTYTIEIQRSTAVGGTDITKNGVSHFDSGAFTVDANAFVQLAGGGAAVETFIPDVGGNIIPTGGGAVTLSGQNPILTNGIETFNISANEMGFKMKSPFTLEDFTFENTIASTKRLLQVNNTDTNALSVSEIQAIVDVASNADTYFNVAVDTAISYAWGMDNSDNFSLKETTAASSLANPSSTAILRKMTFGGIQTLPLQPGFFAYQNVNIVNATGDGTIFTIPFNTKIFDTQVNYNAGTGVFTAPVNGVYSFSTGLIIGNIGAGHTSVIGNFNISTSSLQPLFTTLNPAAVVSADGFYSASGSCIIEMASGDTCSVQVTVKNSTKTITVQGTGLVGGTYFSGSLLG